MYLTKINKVFGTTMDIHNMVYKTDPGPRPLFDVRGTRVTLLSRQKPNLTGLDATSVVATITGNEFLFMIQVHPSKRDHKTGKVISRNDVEPWFRAKAAKGGFEIMAMSVEAIDPVEAMQKGKPFRITAHRIMGMLRITNGDLFMQTLRNGIGRMRTYGFGLLNIFV